MRRNVVIFCFACFLVRSSGSELAYAGKNKFRLRFASHGVVQTCGQGAESTFPENRHENLRVAAV